MNDEIDQIVRRYAHRKALTSDWRYSRLNPAFLPLIQERQRAYAWFFRNMNKSHLSGLKAIEVGSGIGMNLLELISFGFMPDNLIANELLKDRADHAREILPAACKFMDGDAMMLDIRPGSLDIVHQCVVFSSILDNGFQDGLANKMWSWLKPGGAVLWYDFLYDNPKNPDVKGLSRARVQSLFPDGRVHSKRVTLAPPLARLVVKAHPIMYTVFNSLPFLRTHIACWIEKPNA